MTETSYKNEDEIDLSELFTTLWYHKIWIAFITGLFIFCCGYYSVTSIKQYNANAIFEIQQGGAHNLNIPSEFGALASIAGFGTV